ncbi:NUDIX hydrolase [Streptomyces sp. XM4193]|uniref:NUDIX hydrolase n=1 Tax=Streptomyces sp. XM4193 TaxID=2929782 RepID=UPI001FFAAC6A|nr:NUDIX hydrolase [Streptomyces sp. XM4193]MCK1798248.1 NUDIX hydrolase [Streptomyces sp. XM4193]
MVERAAGLVRAAGCVLWRRAAGGGVEIALVHRSRWDDWSHPKGKLEHGERPRDAAVREVREETGMACVPGAALTTVRYPADGGRKQVDYWAAEARSGRFEPNDEVDAVSWLAPDAARALLTRARDVDVLAEALTTIPGPH